MSMIEEPTSFTIPMLREGLSRECVEASASLDEGVPYCSAATQLMWIRQ